MTNKFILDKLQIKDTERKRFVAFVWENHMRDVIELQLNGDISCRVGLAPPFLIDEALCAYVRDI